MVGVSLTSSVTAPRRGRQRRLDPVLPACRRAPRRSPRWRPPGRASEYARVHVGLARGRPDDERAAGAPGVLELGDAHVGLPRGRLAGVDHRLQARAEGREEVPRRLGRRPGIARRPARRELRVAGRCAGGVHVSSSSNSVARSMPAASAARKSRTSHWPCTMNAEFDPSAGACSGELAYVSYPNSVHHTGLPGRFWSRYATTAASFACTPSSSGLSAGVGRAGAEAVVVHVDHVGGEAAAAVRRSTRCAPRRGTW